MLCSPSSGISNLASFKDSVGCYLKSSATVCRVEQLPSNADLAYETFFAMYDNISTRDVVGTASVSEYIMTKPPSSDKVIWPGGDVVYKIGPGTWTLEVQHKVTGLRYRIQFTISKLAGNDIRLTVDSLVKIGN